MIESPNQYPEFPEHSMFVASADQYGPSLDRLCTEIDNSHHMVVATNRGPLAFRAGGDAGPEPHEFTGAASSAFGPIRGRLPVTWISLAANDADVRATLDRPSGIFTGPPLPDSWSVRFASASRRVAHKHYNLVCNPLLWFLHHRTWGPSHTPNIDSNVVDAWDNGHVPVTLSYLAEFEAEARRVGRPLLVNTRDYTLPLLPGLARASLPDSVIVHTSDVPWPGPDWWLLLPARWRESIFRSLLACDVITFPSQRDRRAFAACAAEFVPGAIVDSDTAVMSRGWTTMLGVALPGIDSEGLLHFSESPGVQAESGRVSGGQAVHTFVTVDRAEPHKNIVRPLRAFGRMLELAPELIDRVRYVLVLAPPAPHLGHYRRYVEEIKAEAREQGRLSRSSNHHVELHLERNFPLAVAALRSYDTLISVPLADSSAGSPADGSIVNRRNGAIIVSDTSPAAELLSTSVAQVSPADVEGMAVAMRESTRLEAGERASVGRELRQRSAAWSREASLIAGLSLVADRLRA